MRKSPLDLERLTTESFDTAPTLAALDGGGPGTACVETGRTDPTSDPDVETCGPR